MSICVNASICRCHRGGLSRAQEWCGAGLVAPLVACGPNRTNELAAVLLWREDRRQGVRTTPARRGPRELLIGICWDGGTQCQGHPSIHLTDLQNNVDVWNYVVAAHCHWQSLADINSNQINAAKNSVLAFLSIVPWLRCVTPFVFAFFVIVFVFCVFVFGFEFCFFDPWLRCVTPPSARIGPSPISENTSIRLPHQTGNIRMNKTLCTKKMFVQNWSLYIIQHYQRQSRRSVTSVKFD